MTHICDSCEQPTTWEHAVQTDPWGASTGEILCENCAERAYDRAQSEAEEGFRGGEASAFERAELNRIYRELK